MSYPSVPDRHVTMNKADRELRDAMTTIRKKYELQPAEMQLLLVESLRESIGIYVRLDREGQANWDEALELLRLVDGDEFEGDLHQRIREFLQLHLPEEGADVDG